MIIFNHFNNKPVQLIFYDQLGSYYSDQPADPKLWNIPRFVDEIDEVRKAWNLDDFYLLGQSWGGILAQEYSIKYGNHLKSMIISNMMDNMADYQKYINYLRDQMPENKVAYMKMAEKKDNTNDSEYVKLVDEFYHTCICRLNPWPDAVNLSFERIGQQVYYELWGHNEFRIDGPLKDWSIRDRLGQIKVPTLLLTAKYDSMNPAVIKRMANRIPNAKFHECPNGSHLSMWDDSDDYFEAIERFIQYNEK